MKNYSRILTRKVQKFGITVPSADLHKSTCTQHFKPSDKAEITVHPVIKK
jgi:hypothetical protein